MNQKPQVGVAIIITRNDQVLLEKRKNLTVRGVGQLQADTLISVKRPNFVQHARRKKKWGWM
jgi:hypothetical protein